MVGSRKRVPPHLASQSHFEWSSPRFLPKPSCAAHPRASAHVVAVAAHAMLKVRSASRLFWQVASRLAAVVWIVVPAVWFTVVYSQCRAYWTKTAGRGAWEPAWPIGRTRLVLFVVATPIWAFGMILATIASETAMRYQATGTTSGRTAWSPLKQYETEDYLPQSTRWLLSSCNTNASASKIKLGVYAFVLSVSLWVIGTYEQPNDVRYHSDILESTGLNGKTRSGAGTSNTLLFKSSCLI